MKLADATDPRFTDDQRAQLARFEAAEVPAEVVALAGHEPWCGWQRHDLGQVSSCGCGYLGRTLRALEIPR